ncbi:MAG: hypothetical protein A2Y13_08465 [Planctomycetes bacterium GWC2_45_44]|nr:MAG: hypothetical protein A2Y13_08465 [Planctomycetes bacterium GWC2_45_44]
MANSENEVLEKGVQGMDTYEDEIDLMDYFLVLWKRKWFILLASALPALIVGLVIFFSPRDCTLTFTYNQALGEKDFMILEDTFYSEENIGKLIGKLQAADFKDVAQKLAGAHIREIVAFEVSPSFLLANVKNFEEAQQFKQIKGSLLLVRITLDSDKDMSRAALIFRENIENVMPLYSEKEYLNQSVIGFKNKMAIIEEAKYTLNLGLERKKSTLEKLKKLSSGGLDKLPSDNIVLQFSDMKDSSVYLPLPYQRQAVETQIINTEEQVRTNNEMYDYYTGLLKLSERLLGCVDKAITSDNTLGQFCSSLIDTQTEYKDSVQIADYLKAYIKKVENKVANSMPITEKPRICPIAKGTIKKTGIVFVIAFMLSVFTAFLREGLQKRDVRNEK